MGKHEMCVAVIGCGSGGPAIAAFLAKAGHDVTLFERAPAIQPVGAGFLLQPTGLQVLRELGCMDDVVTHGARIDRLYAHTTSGRTILNLHYGDLHRDLCGVGMHRSVLLHYLVETMKQAGAKLVLNCEIQTMTDTNDRRTVLCDQKGEERGPFDLIVIADGARSQLRQQFAQPHSVKRYPWGALWWIGDEGTPAHPQCLYQTLKGTQKMVGLLPTGRHRTTPEHPTPQPQVSLFWSIKLTEVDAWKQRGLDAWKKEVLSLMPTAEHLLAQIHDPSQLVEAVYHDVVMPRWHTDRAVVIGDAAHAMSPQLGQGVNLALYDAWILAQCINSHAQLPEALAQYTQQRKQHLGFYQFATRWATPFFQSSLSVLGTLRDLTAPVALAIPPLRRQMLLSMTGLKMGLVRRSMPMPQIPLQTLPAPHHNQ